MLRYPEAGGGPEGVSNPGPWGPNARRFTTKPGLLFRRCRLPACPLLSVGVSFSALFFLVCWLVLACLCLLPFALGCLLVFLSWWLPVCALLCGALLLLLARVGLCLLAVCFVVVCGAFVCACLLCASCLCVLVARSLWLLVFVLGCVAAAAVRFQCLCMAAVCLFCCVCPFSSCSKATSTSQKREGVVLSILSSFG